jgi:hypothetical protein
MPSTYAYYSAYQRKFYNFLSLHKYLLYGCDFLSWSLKVTVSYKKNNGRNSACCPAVTDSTYYPLMYSNFIREWRLREPGYCTLNARIFIFGVLKKQVVKILARTYSWHPHQVQFEYAGFTVGLLMSRLHAVANHTINNFKSQEWDQMGRQKTMWQGDQRLQSRNAVRV